MFTKALRSWVEVLKEGEIFLAKETYQEYFLDMEESTFYQLLARIHKEGVIGKLAKGLYYRPYKDLPNEIPSTDQLLDFFTNKNKNGILIGRYMLQDLGIINDASGLYEVLTNTLDIKTQRVMHSVIVKTMQIDFKNKAAIYAIKLLELINIIDNETNIDYHALYNFLVEFALNFDQNVFVKVLQARNYKKRNIANTVIVLEKLKVQNTLSRLLNNASRYQKCEAVTKALEIGE